MTEEGNSAANDRFKILVSRVLSAFVCLGSSEGTDREQLSGLRQVAHTRMSPQRVFVFSWGSWFYSGAILGTGLLASQYTGFGKLPWYTSSLMISLLVVWALRTAINMIAFINPLRYRWQSALTFVACISTFAAMLEPLALLSVLGVDRGNHSISEWSIATACAVVIVFFLFRWMTGPHPNSNGLRGRRERVQLVLPVIAILYVGLLGWGLWVCWGEDFWLGSVLFVTLPFLLVGAVQELIDVAYCRRRYSDFRIPFES